MVERLRGCKIFLRIVKTGLTLNLTKYNIAGIDSKYSSGGERIESSDKNF